MKKILLYKTFFLFLGPFVILVCFFIPKKRKKLIWGPMPIINNKYWSLAMKEIGWDSKTLMTSHSHINKREDFDIFFDDFLPKFLPFKLRYGFGHFFALLYIVRNAKVIHMPFSGGVLGYTPLWRFEALLYRLFKIKTVILPYGSDAYMYSKITDISLRNALLINYPMLVKSEAQIEKWVKYWNKNADCIICGVMTDGMARWDVVTPSHLCIDINEWKKKTNYSEKNGKNGVVKVLHTPNHRGFKGTEFLIKAVEELKKEGLKVDLVLIEKSSNERVKKIMQEVDVLAEQFITGYALSATEGMASGLPVMSNLENESYTRLFRRYSFLDECPILSTSPENIKDNLRLLVENPSLRKELGEAGRKYVEKYHSYKAFQYMFSNVYKKIIEGKDIDLINLFHPLKSAYNNSMPKIKHPLFENKIKQKIVE